MSSITSFMNSLIDLTNPNNPIILLTNFINQSFNSNFNPVSVVFGVGFFLGSYLGWPGILLIGMGIFGSYNSSSQLLWKN